MVKPHMDMLSVFMTPWTKPNPGQWVNAGFDPFEVWRLELKKALQNQHVDAFKSLSDLTLGLGTNPLPLCDEKSGLLASPSEHLGDFLPKGQRLCMNVRKVPVKLRRICGQTPAYSNVNENAYLEKILQESRNIPNACVSYPPRHTAQSQSVNSSHTSARYVSQALATSRSHPWIQRVRSGRSE